MQVDRAGDGHGVALGVDDGDVRGARVRDGRHVHAVVVRVVERARVVDQAADVLGVVARGQVRHQLAEKRRRGTQRGRVTGDATVGIIMPEFRLYLPSPAAEGEKRNGNDRECIKMKITAGGQGWLRHCVTVSKMESPIPMDRGYP